MFWLVLLAVIATICVDGYKYTKYGRTIRSRPLYENFYADFATDPKLVTPKELLGEVNYKKFITKTNPDGLIADKNSFENYDVIGRVRELRLLSLLADSELLNILESKGLSLSKLEKLLVILDNYDALSILLKNRELVKKILPIVIESTPSALPIVKKVLKTNPSSFSFPGSALLGVGVFEGVVEHNILIAALSVLAGVPFIGVGFVLQNLNFDKIIDSIGVAATSQSVPKSKPSVQTKLDVKSKTTIVKYKRVKSKH